jgi:hypothetical protein
MTLGRTACPFLWLTKFPACLPRPYHLCDAEQADAGVPAEDRVVMTGGTWAFRFLKKVQRSYATRTK